MRGAHPPEDHHHVEALYATGRLPKAGQSRQPSLRRLRVQPASEILDKREPPSVCSRGDVYI